MFLISRVWHSQIQHWAFCPNDFLLWDIVQSWSSLWSLMRTERHPTSTKTRTPTAGNDGQGFYAKCEASLGCPCVQKITKEEIKCGVTRWVFVCSSQGRRSRRADSSLTANCSKWFSCADEGAAGGWEQALSASFTSWHNIEKRFALDNLNVKTATLRFSGTFIKRWNKE